MAQFVEAREPITFRVTGKQSIERLEPLLVGNDWDIECIPVGVEQLRNGVLPVFVWETTCEKEFKQVHQSAKIINRLHNSTIIESKANLAFLQLKMQCPTLETFIAPNGNVVRKWFATRWESEDQHGGETDWWAVKASNGNGGKDIWITNRANYHEVCGELRANEEYVLQK